MIRDWLGNLWDDNTRNRERAGCGAKAIGDILPVAGPEEGPVEEWELETALADRLGDLMHWAAQNGVNYDTAAARAVRYYNEERGPQEPDPDPLLNPCGQTRN